MSAYYPAAYPDYCLQYFSPLANQSEYPTIIADAEYVPNLPTSATFTLSDLYCQQSTAFLDSYQFAGAYSQSSGSDYTESPPNTGYLTTQTLVQRQPHQSASRHIWGVRPDPNPMFFIPETDPIPSIRRVSLPPSLLSTPTSVIVPSSPETQAPSHGHDDTYFLSTGVHTSPLGVQGQDTGYGSSSSTPTPSPTPSPTSATFSLSPYQASVKSEASSDSGYRSPSSQLKHADFRRRRADRRRSKLLEIASVLPFRATDPDEMSSHDKRRSYVGTLEEYVVWLEKEMKFFGNDPIAMKKVAKHKGMTCRSLRTMLAHFQDEAHKLHEQVQAQEKEIQALELQALLDGEERHGLETSSTPISSPFTALPIQFQSHFQPQLSASQLQGYEY
ncbi:hypothetical protein BDM02DRAFT_3127646 [Thelephora ganbajun]|uniref:Uncharacterized protein n=1 Tax=Thelephora ganbajun TaxID=370292 RepID=A0ACB6ZLM3_THEGA|nr:hypothetical protein BDM02DRAFT_3127646 [Thelephora ganbajun]